MEASILEIEVYSTLRIIACTMFNLRVRKAEGQIFRRLQNELKLEFCCILLYRIHPAVLCSIAVSYARKSLESTADRSQHPYCERGLANFNRLDTSARAGDSGQDS